MSACCMKPCLLNGKITSRQPTIGCWLCNNIAHPKCADLGHSAGLVADRTKSNSGLDWTCPSCHHIKVNIMAFIRQTDLEYQSLLAGFKDLFNRFEKAESNFKGRILAAASHNAVATSDHVPVAADSGPDTGASSCLQSTAHSSTASTAVSSGYVPTLESYRLATSNASTVVTDGCAADASPGLTPAAASFGPPDPIAPADLHPVNFDQASTSHAAAVGSGIILTPANTNTSPSQSTLCGVAQRVPMPLSGVAQKKLIFVSRLNPGASEEDVKNYLSSKLNVSRSVLTVLKFKFKQRREISSFKIGLPEEHLDKVLDVSIWPEHDLIESVQKQFLLFALRGLNWETHRHLPSYVDRLRLLNLPSLKDRRTCHGVMFLHKLITGLVNSSYLLGQIRLSIPVRSTRHFRPIALDICKTNFELHDPFRVLCSQYNELYFLIFSECSVNLIVTNILTYLSLPPST
ncbi:uncharacterized protein [Drosophila takahashii]|uniref:uncharacterized protein isoform X2 n=1 Tax=Drosophila takahashii TaxID=29030 RepID=UPI0038994845